MSGVGALMQFLNGIRKGAPKAMAKREAMQNLSRVNQKQVQTPELAEAARALKAGDITSRAFRDLAAEKRPPTIFSEIEKIPSIEDIIATLDLEKWKDGKGVIGLDIDIPSGKRTSNRLDIPAYEHHDKWIVSVHDPENKGKGIGYGQAAVLENVNFGTFGNASQKVASNKKSKSTFARVDGDWVTGDVGTASDLMDVALSSPDWVQVGMNPYRAGYFYDKNTMEPMISADQVVQIGPLVMAKNPVKMGDLPLSEAKGFAKGMKVPTDTGSFRLFRNGGALRRV